MLRQKPGFTIAAVLSLALGIGACTAIFSVVDAVLLRALPYPDSERIVQLRELNEKSAPMPVAEPNYMDVRARAGRSFEALAQYSGGGDLATVTGGSEPARAYTYSVSRDFFRVLGVQPFMGRAFLPEETRQGGAAVAIVSYGFWQKLLGAKTDLAGTKVNIGNHSFTVVGVMPPNFAFPKDGEVWIPREIAAPDASRTAHNWRVIARLRSGASLDDARKDVSATARQLKQEYGEGTDAVDMALVPLRESLVGNVRNVLLVLLSAVGLLLLIACANVANLQLARAAARQKEIAIRLALGASRARLMRQLLTESVLLSLMGGAVALLFALWGIDALVAALPEGVPRASEIGLDASALGFTLLISLLTGILLGLAPAWQGTKPDLTEGLKEGGKPLMGVGRRSGVRSLLVIGEVALSLLLLIGAGLTMKSFYRLREVKPGVDSHNVVTMQINLPPARYAEDYKQANFFGAILERISALPGVVSAGATTNLPFIDDNQSDFTIEGRPEAKTPKDALIASYDSVSAAYFRATGIPILKGRAFTEQDMKGAAPVAIISETMAHRFFGGEDPLGRRIRRGDSEDNKPWLTIIGIAGDVRRYGLAERLRPEIYYPFQQQPQAAMALVVRTTAADPLSIAPAVRREVQAVDKDQPVYDIKTMDSLLAKSIASNRLAVWLLGLFAALALLLASIGIYGVIAYSVTQRTREIGIRMALGARPRDVLRLVVGQGMMLTFIGIGLGLVGAFALTRVMASLLFSVSPTDPVTFAAISALLAVVALLACYIPARRATKVDPMVALRHE